MALADIHFKFEILTHEKKWEHLVMKLFTICWISFASTSCPSFGMRNSKEPGSSVITDDTLVFFDGVVLRLVEGISI